MQTVNQALPSAASSEAVTLGILSAIGGADAAGLATLDVALGVTIDMISDCIQATSPGFTLEVDCCIQTATDFHLAETASEKCGRIPGIVVSADPDELLASIIDTPLLASARRLFADRSVLTVLDDAVPRFDQSPDEPTLGQSLLTRNVDVLFVAMVDIASGLAWLRALSGEFPFRDGLVVAAVPDSEIRPVVLDVEGTELVTRPIEELRVRLLRQWAAEAAAASTSAAGTFSTGPRFSIGGMFNLFLALTSWSLPKDWQFLPRSPAVMSVQALAWPADVQILDAPALRQMEEMREQFAAPFAWCDTWAIHFGNVFRTVCLALLSFNLFAVAAAIIGYLDGAHSSVWYLAELISLLSTAALYIWGRHVRIQKKWVEYRLLAELLRPTQYFWAMADMYTPVEPHVQDPELRWWRSTVLTYRRLLRTMRQPRLQMTARYVYGLKAVLEGYIIAQITWHSSFHVTHGRIHRRLVRSSRLAFWLVLAAAAGHLCTRYLGHLMERYWLGSEETLSAVFLGAACILAAVGFAIGILIHQLGFDQIAERSEIAARQLQALLVRITSHRVNLKREHLGRWLSDCSRILIEEQNGWFRQTSRIAIHL